MANNHFGSVLNTVIQLVVAHRHSDRRLFCDRGTRNRLDCRALLAGLAGNSSTVLASFVHEQLGIGWASEPRGHQTGLFHCGPTDVRAQGDQCSDMDLEISVNRET